MLAADKRVSLTDNPRSAGFTLLVDYRPLSLSRRCRLGMCVLKLKYIVHFVFLNICNVNVFLFSTQFSAVTHYCILTISYEQHCFSTRFTMCLLRLFDSYRP